MALALAVVSLAIIVLVAVANRIGVAYPIVLVVGGMALGFVPHMPVVPLNPDLVLVIFLPPLLYWESVTAPTSEFKAGAWWIFQLAFGLVIITTFAVAAVSHAIVPGMSWGVAFVLGAIVSSTDEVAFSAIADQLNVPRHIIGTIEGESLVNDATSLILYAVGIAAVVGASFSFVHAAGNLVLVVIESIALGLAAGGLAVVSWRYVRDPTLQGAISVVVPFLAYLPSYYLGASGVLATVVCGIFVGRYTPTVLMPRAREVISGFWVTVVFLLNAFIFVVVGMDFRHLDPSNSLHEAVLAAAAHLVRDRRRVDVRGGATRVGVRAGAAAHHQRARTYGRQAGLVARDDSRMDRHARRRLRRCGARHSVRDGERSISASRFAYFHYVRGAARDARRARRFAAVLNPMAEGPKHDGADDAEERLALAKTAHVALERIDALCKDGNVESRTS